MDASSSAEDEKERRRLEEIESAVYYAIGSRRMLYLLYLLSHVLSVVTYALLSFAGQLSKGDTARIDIFICFVRVLGEDFAGLPWVWGSPWYGVGMGKIFHPHRPMEILWGFFYQPEITR